VNIVFVKVRKRIYIANPRKIIQKPATKTLSPVTATVKKRIIIRKKDASATG